MALTGSVSIVSANDLHCVEGLGLGCDHMSLAFGGHTLMPANLYRLPKKLWAYCVRDVNLFINVPLPQTPSCRWCHTSLCTSCGYQLRWTGLMKRAALGALLSRRRGSTPPHPSLGKRRKGGRERRFVGGGGGGGGSQKIFSVKYQN